MVMRAQENQVVHTGGPTVPPGDHMVRVTVGGGGVTGGEHTVLVPEGQRVTDPHGHTPRRPAHIQHL